MCKLHDKLVTMTGVKETNTYKESVKAITTTTTKVGSFLRLVVSSFNEFTGGAIPVVFNKMTDKTDLTFNIVRRKFNSVTDAFNETKSEWIPMQTIIGAKNRR